MQKEIWLLLDSSQFGGIESHVLELSSALGKYTNVRVVFLSEQLQHPLIPHLKQRGIAFSFCHRGFASLARLIFRCRPAIIHTHGYKAGISARLLSRVFRFKCISTFHAGEKLRGKLWLYDWIDRHTAFLCSHTFAVSQLISKKISQPNELASNFVDTDNCRPSWGSQIAFVGRLSFEKGPDRFCELARNTRLQSFHVYGDGPMSRQLHSDIPKNMVMHGSQADMTQAWSKIGILIITSRQEGMPMSIIEAMSRGIPVIAFKVGSIAKLIDHGVNGWLVDPGDMQALHDCLREWTALSAPGKRIMGANAKDKINRHFSAAAVIPRYLSVYCEVSPSIKLKVSA